MEPGVKCYKIDDASKKDDLWFHGDSIDNVALTCKFSQRFLLTGIGAKVQQAAQINFMDIRMFLDGIYVFDKDAPLPEGAVTKTIKL